MPQIPTVVAPEDVASPRMSPEIAGEPGMALARTGEALTRTADYGLQVEEHVRAAQEHLALLTAGNQITAAFNTYQEKLARSGDPDSLPDPEAWKEGLKSQLGSDPKYADPRVARALEVHIDAVGEGARHLTSMRQLTLQRQQEVGQLGELKQTVAFEMAEASDPDMRGLARGRYETAVTDAVRHGWVTPKEAETELRTLDSTAEDVEIVNAINKDNPSGIQAMIEKTQNHPELFRHLNPARFAELKKTLRSAYDVAENRHRERDIAGKGDPLIERYKNDVTLRDPETKEFDPLAAAKKLDDDSSIPTDVKKYVRTELEQQAAVSAKVQNSQFSKLLDHLDPQVESGALTFRELTRRENLAPGTPDWIPRRVADALLSKAASIERENRALATQARVTASQERSIAAEDRRLARQERLDKSLDIRDELLGQPGHLLTREELAPYRLKGLSAGDANIVWQTKNIRGDPAWASAVQIIQKSPAFDLTTTDGRTEQSKFLTGFASRVESNHLTGEQITDELTKTLKPLEDERNKSTIRRLLDWVHQSGGSAVRAAAGVEGMAPRIDQTGADPDYDLEAAKAAGVNPDPKTGHMPDTYKRPHHMTFSDESKYSGPGQEGGHWKYVDKGGREMEDTKPGGTWQFFASPFNLTQHTPDELREYFRTHESDGKLFLPIGTKNGMPVYDLGNGKWQTGTK